MLSLIISLALLVQTPNFSSVGPDKPQEPVKKAGCNCGCGKSDCECNGECAAKHEKESQNVQLPQHFKKAEVCGCGCGLPGCNCSDCPRVKELEKHVADLEDRFKFHAQVINPPVKKNPQKWQMTDKWGYKWWDYDRNNLENWVNGLENGTYDHPNLKKQEVAPPIVQPPVIYAQPPIIYSQPLMLGGCANGQCGSPGLGFRLFGRR